MVIRRWWAALTSRDPRPDAQTKAHALAALGGAGCPVCRTAEESVRRWFFAYENDTRVDPGVRERLERSGGFCPPHTRHLLDLGAASSWVARSVFTDVAQAGVAALAANSAFDESLCPACTSVGRAVSDAVGKLTVGLADPEVRQLLEAGDGVCVTHGAAIIERAGPDVGRAVASALDSRLGKDLVTARDHLVGSDPDIARRRRMREAQAEIVLAAEAEARSRPGLADVEMMLDWPCCPFCAVAYRVEWRYLTWLAHLDAQETSDLRNDATLCVRHLGDLVHLRHCGDAAGVDLTDEGLLVAVAAVVEHVAGQWRGSLQSYLHRLDTGGWSDRAAAAVRGGSCQLCVRQAAAVRRELRLAELVAADPVRARRLSSAHGVCLRHGLSLPLRAPWRRLLQSRVGMLAHTLSEAERKSGWDARWELRGDEMAAWHRAPTLLDGAVLGPFPDGRTGA